MKQKKKREMPITVNNECLKLAKALSKDTRGSQEETETGFPVEGKPWHSTVD